MYNMKKLLIISLVILSACQNTYDGLKAGATEDSRIIRARLAENISPETAPQKAPDGTYVYPETYCYKSWSGNVCYDEPQQKR